jgi:hypothetical protein
MKLAVSLGSMAALFVPAVALACPGAAERAGSCDGSLLGYVAAVGVGMAVGVGSVFVERKMRSR